MTLPKYAKLEIERRFLVDQSKLPPLDSAQARLIDDLYLEDSLLRLRSIVSSGRDPEYKLCKKYGSVAVGAEPVVNIYLTAQEHGILATLPGRRLRKRRFRLVEGGVLFGIDQFEGPMEGLVLAEVESNETETEVTAIPTWVLRELTGDPFFTGGNLCRLTADELAGRLARERALSERYD